MPSFQNPLSRISRSAPAAPAPSRPTQIRNRFYKDLREFTAWHPWGVLPGHNNSNDRYIPMRDRFVKQNDYPAELQKLMEVGWKAATAPTGPRTAGFTLGAARPVNPGHVEPVNPLRRGLNSPLRGTGAVANNWEDMKKFEQVAAYSFRGDTRRPEEVMAAGGFFPPSMRTDDFYKGTIANEFYNYMNRREGLTLDAVGKAAFKQQIIGYMAGKGDAGKLFTEYHFWRQLLSNEQMHIATMTNMSFLKAYVSTSRDVTIAASGAAALLGGPGAAAAMGFGTVYALRVKSGFLLKTGVGGVSKKEAEIAHLGPITWKNVYGFRYKGEETDAVYIRNAFDQQDNNAFELVLASLSRC